MYIMCLSKGTSAVQSALDQGILPNRTLGFIPTAGDTYEKPYFVDESRKRLINRGIKLIDLDVANKSSAELIKRLDTVDGIYVAGGNSFYLLYQLLQKNLVPVIIQKVKDGVPYFDPNDELVVIVLTNCLGGPATTIAKGIYGIIDHYQNNTPTRKPKHDLSKLEGRYMNLWGMTNIVVTGDKVVAAYPNTWLPLTQPENLERVDDTTLKVQETNSFLSEGELVHFNMKNGKVETVDYNGTTMWPEEAWIKKQQARKTVSL